MMDDKISQVLGISPESVSALFALILTAVVIYLIKGIAKNWAEKLKFEKSTFLSIGDYVDIPTSVGSDPGVILGYDLRTIQVKCESGIRYIPIDQFSATAWKVLGKKPEFLKDKDPPF